MRLAQRRGISKTCFPIISDKFVDELTDRYTTYVCPNLICSTQMMPQGGRKHEHHIGARIRNANRPNG
jgi:hypothetical protein